MLQGGRYRIEEQPCLGLAAARQQALMTYRSRDSFQERFGRQRHASDCANEFAVQSYLRYQGDKFIRRFDANCYLALTAMMDTHNVARERGDYADVLASITQPSLIMGELIVITKY